MLAPRLIGEFTAALRLHYGPGPHPDGSPQQVHGGGETLRSPTLTVIAAQTPKATTHLDAGGMREGFEIKTPDGASIVGYVVNADFPGAPAAPTRGELFFVTVPKAQQRKGIGTSLARDALRLMRENGAETVNVHATTRDGRAWLENLRRTGLISDAPIRTSDTGKQEYRILADRLALRLHYGPGPHPDGSPQAVHAGGAAIPGPARGKPAFVERGEATGLQRQLAGGGFSYQPVANQSPTDGFMVSPYQGREYKVPAARVTARQLTTYLARNADLLAQPDHYVGGWVDGGTAHIDVSIRVADRAAAAALAKKHGQLAFYDLAQGVTQYA